MSGVMALITSIPPSRLEETMLEVHPPVAQDGSVAPKPSPYRHCFGS